MAQFPNTTAADGIWTLKKVRRAILGENWPAAVTGDEFFANTVLLLNADGASNGGQNNTFLDSSSNAHTITRNGNVTQGSFSPFSVDEGKWGNYFDGNGDSVSIATDSELDWGTGIDFTMECWFYSDISISSNTALIDTRDTSSTSIGGFLGIRSTGVVELFFNQGSMIILSSTTIQPGQWYHIAGVRNSGTFDLFVNGVSEGTNSSSQDIQNTSGITVGDKQLSASGYGSPTGYISNARVVSGTAVYTADFTPSTTPLTAVTNTSLLTCQSNRFVDNSSNAHSITVNGTPKVVPFSPFPQTTAYNASTNGGSGYFDGSGDYLDVGTNVISATGQFSAEAFVYNSSSQSDSRAVVFSQYTSGVSGRWIFWIDSGTLEWIESGDDSIRDSTTFPQDTWVHVLLTRDASNVVRLFIDGELRDYGTNSASLDTSNFEIGGDSVVSDDDFTGYISNVRVVDGSIPSEYQTSSTTLNAQIFTPPTAPLTDITNTSLLCNFTNASIVDATGKNVLETVGNAQVDTTTVKYGTGSMEFDGNGDFLKATSVDGDLNLSADFTIECWVKTETFTQDFSFRRIWSGGPNVANGLELIFSDGSSASSTLSVYAGSFLISGSTTVADNDWHHVAVTRSGTDLRLFIDGVQDGSTATTSQNFNYDNTFVIGRYYGGNGDFNGFIDDFRITKGIARYTANFTPPEKALPVIGE